MSKQIKEGNPVKLSTSKMPNCLKEYVSGARLAWIKATNNCDTNEDVD